MESGFARARSDATNSGSMSGENRYHQRLALYPITPISAARHTGTSPPTRITNPNIDTQITAIRIHGNNERRKSERKIMSIITFDPLTTMICMSHDALREVFNSGLRAFFCPRIIPESTSCPSGGNISDSLSSNHIRIRTKKSYCSGGVLSI